MTSERPDDVIDSVMDQIADKLGIELVQDRGSCAGHFRVNLTLDGRVIASDFITLRDRT